MSVTSKEGLEERQDKILMAIVCEYISSAEPVGSRTIARKYGFEVSPATIRNIMADLEDLGFLVQPHTSAGRIPTDKGLRFYVDHIESPERAIKQIDFFNIEEILNPETELGNLMRKTTALLSRLSNQAGIMLAPSLRNMICRHIDFVRLSNSQVLVIFISETGVVEKRVVLLEEEVSQDILDKMSKLITSELMGLSLQAIREKLIRMMETEKAQFDQSLSQALKLSQRFFAKDAEDIELYVGGAFNMMNQPEFADLEKAKHLFKTLEEKRLLIHILDKCIEADSEHAKVIIGQENDITDMQDLSFVISSYKYGTRTLGVVGIIGPKRMNYTQIIPIVEYTAKTVSRLLTDRLEQRS